MAATPVFATPTNSPLRSSPNVKQFTSTPLHNPIRSSRRSRCISCSDSGQYPSLDLSVEDEDTLEDFPEKYVARSNRSNSLVGRIVDDVLYGSIKYFCRSRGHGFINPDGVSHRTLLNTQSWRHSIVILERKVRIKQKTHDSQEHSFWDIYSVYCSIQVSKDCTCQKNSFVNFKYASCQNIQKRSLPPGFLELSG